MNFPSTLITCFIKGEDGIPIFSKNFHGFFYLAYPYFPWELLSTIYKFIPLTEKEVRGSGSEISTFVDIHRGNVNINFNKEDVFTDGFIGKHHASHITVCVKTKDVNETETVDLKSELHHGKLHIKLDEISEIINHVVSGMIKNPDSTNVPFEKAPYLHSWYVSNISFIYKNSTTKLAELEVLIKDFDMSSINITEN